MCEIYKKDAENFILFKKKKIEPSIAIYWIIELNNNSKWMNELKFLIERR